MRLEVGDQFKLMVWKNLWFGNIRKRTEQYVMYEENHICQEWKRKAHNCVQKILKNIVIPYFNISAKLSLIWSQTCNFKPSKSAYRVAYQSFDNNVENGVQNWSNKVSDFSLSISGSYFQGIFNYYISSRTNHNRCPREQHKMGQATLSSNMPPTTPSYLQRYPQAY